MGMSASQARLLSLTARLSDLEFQAQNISNSKIRLADEAEAASRNYSEALDKQKFTVKSFSDGETRYIDATAYNLTHYHAVSDMDKQRFIKDSAGRVIVEDEVATAFDDVLQSGGDLYMFLDSLGIIYDNTMEGYDSAKLLHYTNIYNEIIESGGYNAPGDDNLNDPEWLQAQVEAGNVYLAIWDDKANNEQGDFVEVSWTSGDSTIQEKDDKIDLARAEAEYQTTNADIQSKDKRFDLQLKEIDTEHNAIQTEIDSVKKVLDKNIERSMKTFNG